MLTTSRRLIENVRLELDTMTFFGKLKVLAYIFSIYRRRNGLAAAIKFLIRGA